MKSARELFEELGADYFENDLRINNIIRKENKE